MTERQQVMPAINVRMPAEFVTWLNHQAAVNGTTLSQEIRSAVATAIVQAGDAEAYGIEQVTE